MQCNSIKGTFMPDDKAALHGFDLLPNAAHVRVPTVAALHGCSIVTVWRMAKDGRLPAPVKRGGVTAWNVGDLRRSMTATF